MVRRHAAIAKINDEHKQRKCRSSTLLSLGRILAFHPTTRPADFRLP